MWMTQIRQQTVNQLVKWANVSLSTLLIVAAIVIVGIAMLPDHEGLKAIILAYIILP